MAAKDIEGFVFDFAAINEPDYGDFMRKANHLLIELDEKIYDDSPVAVRRILDKMKDDIQFHPNWETESTCEEILLLANKVKQIEERTAL